MADKTKIMSQSERIIYRFGGVKNLARILAEMGTPKDVATIYKWTYTVEKGGTGGLLPTYAVLDILYAAKKKGITLTADDFDPRPAPIRE